MRVILKIVILYQIDSSLIDFDIRHTQLLFATGIEHGIHDCQVLEHQPPVTSRVIFHHLIPLMIIEY